jgi:predicted PurR-regulated permease PerM
MTPEQPPKVPLPQETDDLWSPETRERWFYGTLAVSALAVAVLFLPFLDVLMFALVTSVVTRPIMEDVVKRLGGRRLLAAVVTALLAALIVIAPITALLYRFAMEGVALAQQGVVWAGQVEVSPEIAALRAWWQANAPAFLVGLDPFSAVEGADLQAGLRDVAQTLLTGVGGSVPSLLGTLFLGTIDIILFVFTVVVLLSDGPRLVDWLLPLTPLDDRYERRLIDVFAEFARNMVVGALVTSTVQGVVATIGYSIAGLPRALFFGVATAVAALVPVVGTAVIAVPSVVYVGWLHGPEWGFFLLVWSIVLTGGVDNVLRPLLIRGSTAIHPLLIFLAVFGGLSWLGPTGVLVGPTLVAFFLALVTIQRDELRLRASPAAPRPDERATPP